MGGRSKEKHNLADLFDLLMSSCSAEALKRRLKMMSVRDLLCNCSTDRIKVFFFSSPVISIPQSVPFTHSL